jgi:hypothetical protein
MLAYEVVVYINAKKVRQVCAGPDDRDGHHRGWVVGQTEAVVIKLPNA